MYSIFVKVLRVLLGIAVVLAVFFVCDYIVGVCSVKFPSSLIAMLALFALLSLKIIPLWVVEPAGELLMKYMIFLFVPLLALLPQSYDVLKGNVAAIFGGLVISAVLTLSATSVAVEKLHEFRAKRKAENGR